MMGKLKRVEAYLRETLRKNKDAYWGGSQSLTKDNFSSIRKKKNPRKSKKRKRKSKYSSSSSSVTRATSDSDSFDNEPEIKRFQVVLGNEWYKYKISKSMASLANEHFELYLPDKEAHSHKLKENPVPDNVDLVEKLDDFAIQILKDRRGSASNELIKQDKVLEKIQVKVRDIMGPLCRLWNIVEKASNSSEQLVNASLDDMQKFIKQTVLMVGQSSNTVTYHKKYNLLNNLMGPLNQAKEALRENKDLSQKHDKNLLGKKFRNHIVEVTKTRKTTTAAFSAAKSRSGSSRREPFPEALHRKHQQRGRVAGHKILLTRGSNYQINKQRCQEQNSNLN